jgi:hypothetical protein
METADSIRAEFADAVFGPSCPPAEIARAEAALGEEFPAELRELYLAFNGFSVPGDQAYLWPLLASRPHQDALLETNLALREESRFPEHLAAQCLFFGGSPEYICGTGAFAPSPSPSIRSGPSAARSTA